MPTTFKKDNWNKGTPKKWRVFGDLMLLLGTGLNSIVLILPIDPISKAWLMAGTTLLTTAGKFLTKLFGDD